MVVENSYYQHEEEDAVKVVLVTEDEVMYQSMNDTVIVDGERIKSGGTEHIETFESLSEPADIRIEAEAAKFNLLGKNQ